MPTYEYQCKDCGNDLEVVQAFTDDALTECPTCGGPLKKRFGSVGISFKGSGFYKNDSRGGTTSTTSTSGTATSTPSTSDSSSGSSDSSSSSTTSSDASSSGSTSTPSTPSAPASA